MESKVILEVYQGDSDTDSGKSKYFANQVPSDPEKKHRASVRGTIVDILKISPKQVDPILTLLEKSQGKDIETVRASILKELHAYPSSKI